jgi:hypothetical protein
MARERANILKRQSELLLMMFENSRDPTTLSGVVISCKIF